VDHRSVQLLTETIIQDLRPFGANFRETEAGLMDAVWPSRCRAQLEGRQAERALLHLPDPPGTCRSPELIRQA
jgi:hypothetical protein